MKSSSAYPPPTDGVSINTSSFLFLPSHFLMCLSHFSLIGKGVCNPFELILV